MRGCSAQIYAWKKGIKVFPAYAGMFLVGEGRVWGGSSFPRVCGDVPLHLFDDDFGDLFSPRMRGCS